MASGFKVAGVDLDNIFAPWHAGWAQAAATDFEVAGADVNGRYAPLSTGAAAAVTDFKESGGTDLNTIFAAYGTTGVVVATQPGNVSGTAAAGNPSGTVTSNTTTCAGSRGQGSYTYTWHLASGSGVAFTQPNAATTAVTGTVPSASTISGTMYCTISDGVSSVNTNTVAWSLQNTSPQITVIPYTVTGRATLPNDAGAAILFFANGTEQYQTNLNPPGTVGYWNPAGNGSAYDVEATLVSGTAPNDFDGYQQLNTWYQVTDFIGWAISNSSGNSTLTGVIEVHIRLHSTGVVVATGNITLTATSSGS
jgi:hypothetical protein